MQGKPTSIRLAYANGEAKECGQAIEPPKVRQRSIETRGKRHAPKEKRDAQERPRWQRWNGQEQEAGNRDWPIRSARKGSEGPTQTRVEEQ
jgi:hypothetical protein